MHAYAQQYTDETKQIHKPMVSWGCLSVHGDWEYTWGLYLLLLLALPVAVCWLGGHSEQNRRGKNQKEENALHVGLNEGWKQLWQPENSWGTSWTTSEDSRSLLECQTVKMLGNFKNYIKLYKAYFSLFSHNPFCFAFKLSGIRSRCYHCCACLLKIWANNS